MKDFADFEVAVNKSFELGIDKFQKARNFIKEVADISKQDKPKEKEDERSI